MTFCFAAKNHNAIRRNGNIVSIIAASTAKSNHTAICTNEAKQERQYSRINTVIWIERHTEHFIILYQLDMK